MGKRTFSAGAALLLLAFLFIAINVVSNTALTGMRLDLTAERLYTLSDGTRKVLAKLDEPVTLRLFYSERLANRMPAAKTWADRVRDLLGEYVVASDGMVRLEIVDPEPFSESEDEAVSAGLVGTPVTETESLYLGLVGSGPAGTRQTIPFFSQDREAFLEYDLTRLIDGLVTTRKPVVGILSSLPLDTGFGGAMAALRRQSFPFAVYEQLAQQFDVRMLAAQLEQIPGAIDLLIIAHPGPLTDEALYAIDQFVVRGGRIVVLVDPSAEIAIGAMDPSKPDIRAPLSSNLERLFRAWGIEMPMQEVVADRGLASSVMMPGSGRNRNVDYVLWLTAKAGALNAEDVVTGKLQGVVLASAGHLTALEGATTRFDPLITSSEDAMVINAGRAGPAADPEQLLRDFAPTGERYVMAARVSGPVDTAFPDGPPSPSRRLTTAEREAALKAAAPDPQTGRPAAGGLEVEQVRKGMVNAIVIADVDLLDDRFWVRTQNMYGERVVVPVMDNGDLIVNAADNMAGSQELIDLRSRGAANRPFTVIDDLRARAEARYLSQQEGLERQLAETEQRLDEMRRSQPEGGAVLTEEQNRALADLRTQVVETRRALRQVQRDLLSEIQTLETRLKMINIGAVPLLLVLAALVLASVRVRRRKARGLAQGRT